MKKTILLSMATMLMMACGGQSSNTEGSTDSLAVSGDSALAESKAVNEPVAGDSVAEGPVVVEPVLNADMFGKWNNRKDPNISMTLSDKYGTYDGNKGYGYLSASNEYFENEYNLVFTSITPDGDKIHVKYNKMESYYNGDPDDPDGEMELVTRKAGSGELTLVPAGVGKLKIESSEKLIRNATLYK